MASVDPFEQVVKAEFGRMLRCICIEHRVALEQLATRLLSRGAESAVGEEHTGISAAYGSEGIEEPFISCSSRDSGCSTRAWEASIIDAGVKHHSMDGGGPKRAPPARMNLAIPQLPNFHPAVPEESSSAGCTPAGHDTGGPPRLLIPQRCRQESMIWGIGSQAPFRGVISGSSSQAPVHGELTMTGTSSTGSAETGHFTVLAHWRSSLKADAKARKAKLSTMTSFLLDEVQHDSQLLDGPLKRIMLLPNSMQHFIWGIVGFACVAHDIVSVPLQTFRPAKSALTLTMSWLVRIFWTLDICVNFLTGYVSPDGAMEMRPAKVAWQYLRTWFCMDLLLAGCDWVETVIAAIAGERGSGDAVVLNVLGLLRAIRLVRIVRVVKEQKISAFVLKHIRSEGVRVSGYILSILAVLLCLVHIIACLWHGIRVAANAAQADVEALTLTAQYLLSFHHMLALFSGEQILEPRNPTERMFIITVLIFAFLVSGAFVGSLTSAMTQLFTSKRSAQFAALSQYLSDCNISPALAARVHQNAWHALADRRRHTQEGSVELMALISDPLKSEIHYEVHSPTLVIHPFFRLYGQLNPVGMRHICHAAVLEASVSRGDIVFAEYEVPSVPRMFFVISGHLKYTQGLLHRQDVGAGQWLAEAALWTSWAHRGTLCAFTECRLLVLDADCLAKIMGTFPTHHGIDYASKFVGGLNLVTKSSELTDMPDQFDRVRDMAVGVFTSLDKRFELPCQWQASINGRRTSFASRLVGDWTSPTTLAKPTKGKFSTVTPEETSVID